MNCVNKKSKEFKKLVADYNVSENTMELLIHKYWREKRSEEDFPTRAYLNAHLGLAPYEESIDSVIKVWNKMYSHPITYDKKVNAYKAKNNALKIFPSKAVNLYLNAEGNYVLSIRKPVKNLKAELNRIADNGSFSEKSLNLNIEKNKKYQLNKLESLFNQFNTDRTSKALAYKAFNLANSLKISAYFTDMNDENLGKYIPGKGIYFNKDFFSRLDNNEKKASIILHEVLHAVCNYALSDVIRDEDKPQAALDFKNEITEIYNRAKYFEALKAEVGITSVREFVAELSNPLFREKLQSIKNINNMSLWQKIVEAIKKFLNIHSSSDYYTRAMNTLNNALDAFDKNTYMEYNGILDELRKSQDGKHLLSAKAKAFLNTLSDEEVNNITSVINREISDYKLATEEQSSKRSKQYFTFDDGTQVEAPFTLNEQQAKALNEMNRFIHSDETVMTLSGYAGTGKTSLMEMLRNRAWREGKDVIFTATTNKAAAVLKSKVGDGAMTLNKAFGISVEVNTSKAYDTKNLVNKIKESNHIHYGSIVVIDEASMINEANYAILNDIARGLGAKIIYVGDSAQLAPVKETKISKVFRDENGKTVELTQVERTGDNAILREATDVRNGKGLSGISSFNKEGKGVAYLRPEQKKEIGDVVRHFLPQIKENPDNFKIIAFTNNKVASYNEAVRKTLGYNDSTPRVGESIMGYLNYGYRNDGSYYFINSENYKVVHVSPAHTNTIILNGTVYETTINNVTLEGPDGEANTFAFTDVKHNQHNRQVAYTLGKEVAKLWETYRWSHDRDILGKINDINTALFINDDIKEGDRTIVSKVYDFGYAITAHKSQGSTFKNVLIDDVDIQTARENDVDLGTPADNYDIADPSSMMPTGKVAMDDVYDMNDTTELSSTSFSLGEEISSEVKPVTKPHSDNVSLVQQLEYVAISRATDTATIISDNVKKEGSPLHPEKSLMEESSHPNMPKEHNEPNNPPSIAQQLVNHLKSQGINVLGREAMAEFLKTHGLEDVQQMASNYYMPLNDVKEVEVLRHDLFGKFKEKSSFGCIGRTANFWYLCDYFGDSNYKVRAQISIDGNEQFLNEFENAIRGKTFRSPEDFNRRLEAFKSSQGQHYNGGTDVKVRITTNGNAGVAVSKLQGSQDANKGRGNGYGSVYNAELGVETFTTPQGEVYGFVDKEGNIYLDETKISPEHPIHEYTHLWDRTVQQKNPKLWQRGVELMKQTSLWNKILNDERYGKIWQTQSLSQEELDNLVASEVHARFTGKGGEQLLEKLAKEKGQEGIIDKLKQWILDVWKNLKATLGNWSQEDIDKLTLKDFNHMTVRDFADGINLKDAENATYTQQQRSEPNQPTMPVLPEGPIKPSQPQKVSLPGYEHFDRMVKNGEQKGIEVDAEWKVPLLKELDSKIYNPSNDYEALGLKYDEERKSDRLNNEFNINQMNVLLRRVHSKDDWNNLELRNKLIKEEYEQNQYDKLARQIDNLNNPDNSDFDTPLTSSQVKQGVEMAMDYASDIITRLQAEGEEYAKEINPNFQPKKGFNFNTASRQKVIEAVGLSNIFHAVYEWFDYRNDWCDSDEALDEAGDKMSYFHDNWDAVMWMGAPFFNFNEGFGFKEQIGGVVERAHEDNQLPHDETYNKEDEEDVLVELFGEGREHYLVDSRTIDTLASMSTTVKRALHECYKLDEDGNPIVNRTWGLKERINVKDSTISILSWTQGAVSYEDMLAKISQKAKLKKNNWVNQLLIKLNDNSGQYTDFQSQFFNVFCKHRTAYTVAIDEDGKIKSIPANKNPVLKQVMDAAKAKFNAEETPLFTSRRVNTPLLGNKETVSDKYAFNLHQAYNELDTLDKSLDIRVNYQRRRKALTEEQIEKASETLSRVMQAVGFTFVKEEVEDILDESSLHQMTDALRIILKEMSRANDYKTKNPNSKYEIAPFSYTSDNGITGALKNLIKPITDSLEEVNQNTVYDDGKLYQEFTIPSFLSKLCQKFAIRDDEKFNNFLAEEYGKSEFFSMGHSFSRALMMEEYKWRVPWLSMMGNGSRMREHFDHRVNLSYKGKGYMKKMSDLEYAMSVLSQYWSMSSNMRDYESSYFRMPMQSNKPTEDYIGFVAFKNKETYKKNIVEGYKGDSGLYSMFLMELSRIQTVRMRNKDVKEDSSAIKNFDTNGRNFCFFKFLNPYLNRMTNKSDSMYLLAPERVFDDNGNAIENHDDAKFASLLQKKVKGEEALTSEEELELGELAKKAIRSYLQNRFDGILDSWEENGLIKAARNIANIAEFPECIENKFDENSQKEQYDVRETEIDSYIRSQLENFLWNDYFATKNILMLTVGDTAFYKDEEDLQKRLAQLHAPGVRGRVSAIDYNGKPVSDGKYRTVILKDFDKVKSNISALITEVFDRKIAAAPDNMKAQWEALRESVLKAYSEINVADAEGYTSPTAYRKKAIMFGKWSKEAEAVYQKISRGETVSFTDIKQAFQPLKPFVYSHLQKPMGIDNAPITNMYCPFQAKNSEYLLVMADVLLRNEKTSRPNLLKAIFDVMEDSAFDGRTRDKDGKVSEWGTYNGKGIDTIQFESAIKSSLQGAVDIAKFADDLVNGEKGAKDALHDAIYKAGTEGYNSSAYNTDVFVHELPFEDYCLQQDVPDHFKDHEQAHGSQTRMIIPSDLEEYYDEKVGKDNPDNIVKYEYDEWQEVEKDKWEKVHVSKTAKEIKEEYENTIFDNIVASLDNLVEELHLDASSRVEQNLALSKILQRELHSSPRYGIDLIQACTIDKVTGEFRIPKGDPIQCKRIEQLINSIIKNRVNKQLIPGGPIVQVSNFGTSRQLQIRFNDKKGKLLPIREEYDASKHEGKSYENYCKENQGGIAYFEVFAPAWSEDLYRNFADKDGTIDVTTLNDIDPDLLKLITYRIPTEDKCSIAPCKIVGFLPKEAGSTIMLPYELTSQDGSDFDIDKRYVMRKALDIVLDYEKIANALYEKSTQEKNYSEETSKKVKADIDNFLKVIRSDHSYTAKYVEGGKALNRFYNELKENKETWRTMYKTARPKGRNMRNNKIIDISWSVLTNPTSADKVLKPEGFDEQKKVGYMIAAYRNNPEISWEELEHIANDKDGIKNLKELSYTEKDLAFFDTQLQFYKQNAVAASLIGVFAVNKIAHSTLEGDGIYLTALGSAPFTIGHKQFKEKMELDPRFDTEGNNIGNVLGSLVGASADAVKDPILNLMNINMNTANILNALLRLGMSFKEAAMFLSQSVITKALAECDKQNLNGFASIRNIVEDKVKAMNQKHQFSSDSTIVTEEISPEELVEGLLEGDHEALDYKVLIAFNKILDIADKLRNPTLVTRFNSIAGAVGPLTIDNLMTEYKLENFNTIGRKTTGFEYKDKDGEWQPATFSTILEKHPILAGFYSTYGLANKMFSDTPAGSRGFSKVINSLGPLGGKIMGNRQLLNSLVNFYSTFLLIDSGLVDSSKLEYYIKDFPIEFSRVKDSGKYKNNKLVESIFLKEYSKSSTPALQLNLTGLDTLSKEELSSAWIDLYNDNKSLALKLFAYNVFKGGLEFSPKTFISLLPNYIKERIIKKLPDGKKLSYVDVFRKLDFSKADPDLLVDQFVRNNWDNNSLVPYIKLSRDMLFQKNVLSVATDEDKRAVVDSPYIKMKIGSNLLLLKYDDKGSDKKVMNYKVIAPLGNNKEYLEMSPYDIVKPMSDPNQGNEELETPHISSDNLVADGTTALTEAPIQETATQEDSKKALDLAEMFMAYNNKYDKRKANEIIGNYKRNIEQYGKLFGPQYDLLRGVFEKQGLKLNDKQLIEKFKELC